MTTDSATAGASRRAGAGRPHGESAPEREYNEPEQFRQVGAATRKRLFAVFDDPEQGVAAVGALAPGDCVPDRQTWLMHGEEGLRRLDAAGSSHGVYGRLVRGFQLAMTDDSRYLDGLEGALERGALVVALPVADIETADRLASELQRQGGHTFAYTPHMGFVPTAGEI